MGWHARIPDKYEVFCTNAAVMQKIMDNERGCCRYFGKRGPLLKKLLALAFGAGISACSFASFELLLALDYQNSTIHRYDGTTGASLGTFGSSRLVNPSAMAVDVSTNTVSVFSATNTITVFNYNTGVVVNEFTHNAGGFATMCPGPAGSFLIGSFLNPGNVVRYNALTGTIQASYFSPVNSSVRAMGYNPDGSVYIYYTATGEVSRYNPAGGVRTNAVAGPGAELSDSRQMTFMGSSAVVSLGSGKGYRKFIYGTNAWTAGTSVESSNLSFGYGLTRGHGSQVFLAGYNATNGLIEGYDLISGTHRQTITGPNGSFFVAMASVVAPEPTTLLALGVGSLLVLRRKRS